MDAVGAADIASAQAKDARTQSDTADSELLRSGQTSGMTMQVRATAVNTAGESVPSDALGVVVA